MKVFLVIEDYCNEEDCGCKLEGVESVWLDKEKASARSKLVYQGRVEEIKVSE